MMESDFDPFTDNVPHTNMDRLRSFSGRAKYLVRNRSAKQLRDASRTIEMLMQDYFYSEKERWIRDKVDNGGHIWGYLHHEDRDERGLRELIDESHGSYGPSGHELDYARAENTRPLDALESILYGADLDDEDFPNAKPYEYLAVLALEQIGDAVRSYMYDDYPPSLREDAPMIRMGGIANNMVDIVEIVCAAESMLAIERAELALRARIDKILPKQAEDIAKKKVSLAAKKAASARHAPTNQQKATALDEWDANGANVSSMAAFARTRHKGFGVTERTLYDWIRDRRKEKV